MFQNVKKRLKNQRGLTLVELLAVIVILGIISAIAIPSIGGIIQKSKEDALKADAIAVLNAAKLHISSTNLTPDSGTASGSDKGTITMGSTILSDYIDSEHFTSTLNYSVVYDLNDQSYKLSSPAMTVGSTTITFDEATLTDINNDKDSGNDRSIPE